MGWGWGGVVGLLEGGQDWIGFKYEKYLNELEMPFVYMKLIIFIYVVIELCNIVPGDGHESID